ncbi:MAG: hypothetical protein R3F41_07835 [Gammaproteobacteria bacterium]|nr:hypothetical protein [Pseudomonadales bacterium]MCP5349269.1 hypothetical protein [Pseudomonadales bacterium]
MLTQSGFLHSTEELPQQRLFPAQSSPDETDIEVDFPVDASLLGLPEKPEQHSLYVASLEWTWLPVHICQDHFYLSWDGGRWYLWNRYLDDLDQVDFGVEKGFISLQPSWVLRACCKLGSLNRRKAAMHLMKAYLTCGLRDVAPARCPLVASEGLLSDAELIAFCSAG